MPRQNTAPLPRPWSSVNDNVAMHIGRYSEAARRKAVESSMAPELPFDKLMKYRAWRGSMVMSRPSSHSAAWESMGGVLDSSVYVPSTDMVQGGWGRQQFMAGIPHNIPESVFDKNLGEYVKIEGDTLAEKAMHYGQLTGKPAILRDTWEDIYTGQKRSTEWIEDQRGQGWLRSQSDKRAKILGKIDPRLIDKDLLTDLNYGVDKSGKLYRVEPEKFISTSKIQSKSKDISKLGVYRKDVMAGGQGLVEVAGDGIDYEAMNITSVRQIPVGKKIYKGAPEELAKDLSRYEFEKTSSFTLGGTTPKSNQKLKRYISSVGREEVGGKLFKSDAWLVGDSVKKMHYMGLREQQLWGKDFLGQTKFLRALDTGKPFLLGSEGIAATAQYSYLPGTEMGQYLSSLSKVSKEKAFWRLRSDYFTWADSADSVLRKRAETYRQTLVDLAGGEQVFRKDFRLSRWRKGFIGHSKQLSDLQRLMGKEGANILRDSKRNVERLIKHGIIDSRDIVEASGVGTRFWTTSGRELISEEITSDKLYFTASGAKGRGMSFAAFKKQNALKYNPNAFPVIVDRVPGVYDSAMGYEKFATRFATPSGKTVGHVGRGFNESKYFLPQIKSGILPMGDMELRRYKYKGTALAKASSSWQYWDEVPGHMKVAGGRHYRNISDPMYAGRGKKHLKLGKWVKGRAPIYRTEEVAAQKLATSSKYLIAAAVTAGALLLWNATRSKQRTPLDQRDIPASTHGEPSNMPVGADNLPSYQPTARITPNRAPAYNTNIDMNTEDYNDVVDYKNIANTMSSMSRAALGIESANVNLNVMDDSRKMNPYTIQRELSEYLNKG